MTDDQIIDAMTVAISGRGLTDKEARRCALAAFAVAHPPIAAKARREAARVAREWLEHPLNDSDVVYDCGILVAEAILAPDEKITPTDYEIALLRDAVEKEPQNYADVLYMIGLWDKLATALRHLTAAGYLDFNRPGVVTDAGRAYLRTMEKTDG